MLVLAASKNCSSAANMSELCLPPSSSSSSTSSLSHNNMASSSLLSTSPLALSSECLITYPCDDIWKKFDDFLLTPPQSPPVNLDDSSFDPLLDDALSVVMNDLNESTSAPTSVSTSTVIATGAFEPTGPIEFLNSLDAPTNVLRDCMWSGACVEDCMQTNSLCQLALLDSSLNEILACHTDTLAIGTNCDEESDEEVDDQTKMEVEEEEVEDSEESEDEPYSRIVSDSLLDHSYGTSQTSISLSRLQSSSPSASYSPSSSVPSSPSSTFCPSPRSSTSSSHGSISLIEPSSRSRKMVKKQQQQQHSTAASTPTNTTNTSSTQLTNSSLRPQRQRVPKRKKDELLTPVPVKFVKSRIPNSSKEPNMKHKLVCKSPQRRKNTIASLSLSCNSVKSTYLSSPSSSFPHTASSSTTASSSAGSFHFVASLSSSQGSSSPLHSSSTIVPHTTTSASVLSSASFTSNNSLLRSKHKNLPPERRRDHNDNEKKRRDQLRGAFHCLRDQVPKLKDSNRKPPRIVILHEASTYVKNLVDKQKDLEKVKKSEQVRNQKLLRKLASLRNII